MSRTPRFLFKLLTSLFSLFFLLAGCKQMVSQNPEDSFTSGKFPRALESIRSQVREIPLAEREKILARMEADQQNPNILKVAVITEINPKSLLMIPIDRMSSNLFFSKWVY